MPTQATARIAATAPAFVERATSARLDDWLDHFAPDVVVLTGDGPAPRAASALRRATDGDTPVFDPDGHDPVRGVETVADVRFVFAPTVDDLAAVADVAAPDRTTVVVSGLLSLDVDRSALATSLVGREAYRDALDPDRLDGPTVHLSTRLPAEYRRDWDGLTVVGAGADAGTADEPLVALDCRADGTVLTRTLSPSRLGLRALDGVGEARARSLREAGYRDRAAVAAADHGDLADLSGLGDGTANRVLDSARALAEDRIVRRTDVPMPDGDPLFVDLETDGLSPTVTWLVGVLDGGSDGSYRSFLARDPDDPGAAIRGFLSWYEAEASGRPVVAYNGWRFDFPVLDEHVAEYCPDFAPVWRGIERFDPYRFAVEEGNAVLPGLTNALADVAAALGHEPADTGLTGAAVARAYRRWMADPSPETEPDWDRFDAYCEDDTRALAVVHEALAATDRVVSTDRGDDAETTQGSLADW